MASYQSFILRVRNDEPDATKKPRRFYILLNAECGYRRGFPSLEQLFKALCAEICGDALTGNMNNVDIIREVEEILSNSKTYSSD